MHNDYPLSIQHGRRSGQEPGHVYHVVADQQPPDWPATQQVLQLRPQRTPEDSKTEALASGST